ncbi:MAG TPA: sigma 54-interacting transcriptional regulator [Vicinamibacterales bacterium]|nr:sigma 54-interacting transcriptional regulator [Vicinamibacterales bacterium]
MLSPSLHPVMARAAAAAERGQAGTAIEQLAPLLRRTASLTRNDELAIRSALAEAYLLQGDLTQAASAVGRSPDSIREPVSPVILSNLWRAHGRIAFARGEQSRAIALHSRALKQAETAHDSRAIGLAHFCLGQCYRKVGDLSIVREHIAEAAAALHAAGDRRYLAQVHSLSATTLAQSGRYEEAAAALRQAERLATVIQADDVLAMVYGNQANVALIRHRYDQALALAERAVALHDGIGEGPGLSRSLATLGQICVRLGNLERADTVLHRALDARCAVQFHETTGAVYDTLAQMSLMRGDYENAAEYLRQAAEAFGAYGRNTSRWYEWSLRVITARLATRRGNPDEALAIADEISRSPAAPPAEAIEAELIAVEALVSANRVDEADRRLTQVEGRLDPRTTPGAWGEFLRLRGDLRARQSRSTDAYHDIAQSSSVFELVGERYQAAVSQLALARLAGRAGARSTADRHYQHAAQVFQSLGATRDLEEVRMAMSAAPTLGTGEYVGSPADADDALVRRLVDAAVLPDLLARELAATMLEALGADMSAVFVQLPGGDVRVLACAGTDADGARSLGRQAVEGGHSGSGVLIMEAVGREPDGPRFVALASPHPAGHPALRRLRMMVAVARQGFELCGAREVGPAAADPIGERPLEPLLPGFVCASAAMHRVVDQIQRLQGNDLTVLITGESGTGKELVARAIHVGSPRSAATFLPYNCTTTTRELADSQLFGHRRGSFTGAVSDQPGLVRTAGGGTLFLDEVGDLPIDVQPKLLRFLEQGEIMPVGETRPQVVDVRVIAATNADLEQRVGEGKFREDLYYRLSVIRIHVPPLRQRREEIPHLSTYFLREAWDRLGKPDTQLGSDVLDLFAQYWWPGNVRQLRNEIQRAVAMAPPGGLIVPEHLSADLTAAPASRPDSLSSPRISLSRGQTLAALVDDIERDLIRDSLARHRGNISETARVLGLTRRGLYLKLRRLGLDEPSEMVSK